jgi:hypothetical protein
MLFGGGCSAESCSGSIRNSVEKGISRGANCQVFALVVFEIRRAPRLAHFPVVMVRVATLLIYCTLLKIRQIYSPFFISRRAKSNTTGAKTALQEILLQEEIQN